MSILKSSGGLCEPANGLIYYSFVLIDGKTYIEWQPKPWKRAALKPEDAKFARR
jgi:hypothetical protein